MTSPPFPNPEGPLRAEDLDLVARVRKGDEAAIEALTSRLACVPAMLRERHRRVGNPLSQEDLREIEQDTLTALWIKLGTFEGRASLETWAYRFVVFELQKGLERRRKRSRFVAEGDAAIFVLPQPERADPAIDIVALHAGLDRVGPPGSDIIRMRHFEELQFEEIAARMSEPCSTIKARYYRGLERLRTLLEPLLRRATS